MKKKKSEKKPFGEKIQKREASLIKLMLLMAMSALLLFPTSCNLGGDDSGEKAKEKPTEEKAQDEQVSESGIPTGKGFSANVITILPNGIKTDGGKLHVIPGVARLDEAFGGVSTFRFDKENKEYIYNHTKKIFFVVDINEQDHLRQIIKKANEYEFVEVLGKEKINNVNCTKKKVRTAFEFMGMKSYTYYTLWEADGMEYPVRVKEEERDGEATELVNISFRVPSSNLFERPTGYTETDSYLEVLSSY